MNENTKLSRRTILQAGAAGLGLLVAGGCRRKAARHEPGKLPLDSRFTYDVSPFEHTDPALLLYAEAAPIPTGFAEPKCIAVDSHDLLYVGGDRAVKVFGPNGKPFPTLYELPDQPRALAPADNGLLWVAMQDHLEAYRVTGERVVAGESLGEKALLTGLALAGEVVFAADAGHREILRCDLQGRVLGRFGRLNSGDGNPGFLVPSPFFHVLYGADGLLWVNNPGRHRIEAYTLDGHFELGWGRPAMQVDGFCGCCNPVYFARLPDGRFVTSEKGLNRIKVYDAKGVFAGVVAGPEQLVQDRALARKACADCRIGFGFDVACDSKSRVLALDPATRAVRVFTPQAPPPDQHKPPPVKQAP
ncbi:MAG: hypothetical protein NTV49_03125 [Kiritimatiellaeota bacterium]|nr:hypothetical protein [Kiritimatiellota bacterium]